MRRNFLLFMFVFFSLSTLLFARGQTEEATAPTQNNEWVLCITEFDIQAMPAEKLTVASVLTREIVERLNTINYRTHISPEYAFYEGQAWARARNTAARNLSAKHDERSLLIFRGESRWRYRQNLERLDADIERLKVTFEEIDNNPPLINEEPVFSLTTSNLNYSFPAPPRAGNENRFCTEQRADAFLTGSIMDFHGRYFVSFKLYTLYTRSFVYEDSMIFSTEEFDSALDEITARLIMAISGNKPSAIVVQAEPEDTLVLINRTFAGRGDTGVLEHSPGTYTITASAPDHESITIETDLSPGELTDIQISLRPIQYSNVEISGVSVGNSVYRGSLYIGESPLTLRLPVNALEYVELDSHDNRRGTAIFRAPYASDNTYSLTVRTSELPVSGLVNRERRLYYWAWGGTWVTGIAAWIAYNTFNSADAALRQSYDATGSYDQRFLDQNVTMYYLSMGTMVAVGAVSVLGIIQMIRYIHTANKGSVSVVRTDRVY